MRSHRADELLGAGACDHPSSTGAQSPPSPAAPGHPPGSSADERDVEGVRYDELLKLPQKHYFRRRGVPAFTMVGFEGESYSRVADYGRHLLENLPDAYRSGEDFRNYLKVLGKVAGGEMTLKEAVSRMPEPSRVAGACPCSKSVRWVRESEADGGAAGFGYCS